MTSVTRRVPTASFLLLLLLLLGLGDEAHALAIVSPDVDYDPVISNPTYPPMSGPVVGVYGVDTSYSITSRFQGFERLLTADGYVVQSFDEAFVPGCSADLAGCSYFQALLAIDTLVIANRRDPISDEEADVLMGWVSGDLGCEGGCAPRRLFVSAGQLSGSYDPNVDYPAAIAELSERLGLLWPDGALNERVFGFDPADPDSEGLLNLHPIVAGDAEAADRVQVFAEGTAFTSAGPPQGTSILEIPEGASDAPAGYSQGMTFEIGTGRVYVSADADMHTALKYTHPGCSTCSSTRTIGLRADPSSKNERYLLNVMHWLDGRLEDGDGDFIPDSVDNCVAEPNGPGGSNQLDADLDGFGNACDGDFNNDGVIDVGDFDYYFLPDYTSGVDSGVGTDMSGDGLVNGFDFVLFVTQLSSGIPGPSGLACAGDAPCFARTLADADGDAVSNGDDSCVGLPNPSQLDADLDGFGNACDGDFNNDGVVGVVDVTPFQACFSQSVPTPATLDDPVCAESDMDGSGFVDQADLDLWELGYNTGLPGPSGKECADAQSRLKPCRPPLPNVAQRPDPDYDPVLAMPEYAPGSGPLVAVDSTHNSFHVISNRYQGFYKLLTADGYDVYDFGVPFVPGCSSDLASCAYFQALLQVDTLVISNARTDISVEEAEVITGWLSGALGCPSGSCDRQLMLIADHQANFADPTNPLDFPLHVVELSVRLGLDWPNNNVSQRTFVPDPSNPDTQGLLDTAHAIVQGRLGFGEGVAAVTTFTGSGLMGTPPPGGVSLLTLLACATDTDENPIGGYSQGMVFEFGTGRVYASGEAGMFSAQTIDPSGPFGMQILPFDHNQQYLLNILHWFDGLL